MSSADDNREALADLMDPECVHCKFVADRLLANRDAVLRALVPEHPDDLSLSDLLCDAQDRAEAAERKVARVEALRDNLAKAKSFALSDETLRVTAKYAVPEVMDRHLTMGVLAKVATELTAALADEVDDSNDESLAQTTGHAGSQEDDR